jgi:hypothetical protein
MPRYVDPDVPPGVTTPNVPALVVQTTTTGPGNTTADGTLVPAAADAQGHQYVSIAANAPAAAQAGTQIGYQLQTIYWMQTIAKLLAILVRQQTELPSELDSIFEDDIAV